jgi:hypothetical protein
MVTPLATSLLHFQLIRMFKNMVCILGLFNLATVLATFQKILGNFFSNHLVTLPEIDTHIGEEVEQPWANLSKLFTAVIYGCS